jgi:transposase-like protein
LAEGLIPPEGGSCQHPRKYPPELRERAQRLVTEARAEDPSLPVNQVVLRIGPRVGVVPDTSRGWVKQAGIDDGLRPKSCQRPQNAPGAAA